MKAKEEIQSAIRAGYAFFFCQTWEVAKAAAEIMGIVREIEGYIPTIWDFAANPDPDGAIQAFDEAPARTVLIAKNLNWFMADPVEGLNKQMISLFQSRVGTYSSAQGRKVLIIVSDSDFAEAIPRPLQKDFLTTRFEPPDLAEIKKQYDFIIASVKAGRPDFQPPDEQTEKDILLSCRGMTVREIQNALAYSLVQDKGVLNPRTVAGIRAKGIEKTAGIKIGKSNAGFDSLKGYENIKTFARETVRHPLAKGILLLGPPGTGKTAFCRCLAYESGLQLFEMEMAEMFGLLVGETEKQIRAAIDVLSANAPAIVLIDELEKALAGMKSAGANDGGTTKRAMAQFLKFLSEDRPEGLYIVATCNDILSLPPEWVRAERWDCIFFIDLPNDEEQAMVLDLYRGLFNVEGAPRNMSGWSGAEIKSACRIAAMMGQPLEEVERFIVPIAKTMATEIDRLRKWANGRTIPASTRVAPASVEDARAIQLN